MEITSDPKSSQVEWKNSAVKPSGPGVLPNGSFRRASLIWYELVGLVEMDFVRSEQCVVHNLVR